MEMTYIAIDVDDLVELNILCLGENRSAQSQANEKGGDEGLHDRHYELPATRAVLIWMKKGREEQRK